MSLYCLYLCFDSGFSCCWYCFGFLGLCSSFRLLSFGNCRLLLTFGLWRLLFTFAFALAITFGFVDILISIVFQYIAKDYTTIQGDISTYYTEKCTRNVKYHVLHYLECVIVSIWICNCLTLNLQLFHPEFAIALLWICNCFTLNLQLLSSKCVNQDIFENKFNNSLYFINKVKRNY